MEWLSNLRKKAVEVKPLSPDLKELVLQKQRTSKRITHLESDMELVASDKNMITSSDGDLLDNLSKENKQTAKRIYDLCLKYGEDRNRFLSEEEIGEIRAETE